MNMSEDKLREIINEELYKFDARLYKGIENYFNKRIDFVANRISNSHRLVIENNLLLKDCADADVIERLKKKEEENKKKAEIEDHLEQLRRLGYDIKK